jgi:hypothetical protein
MWTITGAMRAGFVVIFHERQQQVTKVPFPKHYNVVNASAKKRQERALQAR